MCLSSRGKLTVGITTVYQLKIKYVQDKFGEVFSDTFNMMSLSLEGKHIVNEHQVNKYEKSLHATWEKCSHVVHLNV